MHLHLSTTGELKEGETIGDVFPGGELNVQCVYVTNPLRTIHVMYWVQAQISVALS